MCMSCMFFSVQVLAAGRTQRCLVEGCHASRKEGQRWQWRRCRGGDCEGGQTHEKWDQSSADCQADREEENASWGLSIFICRISMCFPEFFLRRFFFVFLFVSLLPMRSSQVHVRTSWRSTRGPCRSLRCLVELECVPHHCRSRATKQRARLDCSCRSWGLMHAAYVCLSCCHFVLTNGLNSCPGRALEHRPHRQLTRASHWWGLHLLQACFFFFVGAFAIQDAWLWWYPATSASCSAEVWA